MSRPSQPELRLRITTVDPVPGVWHRLQSGKSDLVRPVVDTAAETSFDLTVRVGEPLPGGGLNFLGPCTQGPPRERFVYVCVGKHAGQPGTAWDRRAKIPLGGISAEQVAAVLKAPGSFLEVRYPGRGRDGGPTCATVRLSPGAWIIRRSKPD